jgi:hypothetical protein
VEARGEAAIEARSEAVETRREAVAVRAAVASALVLHAMLLFATPGLHGGADLILHLGAIVQMEQGFGLRVVYPPAFHLLGGALAPVLGLGLYLKLFAFFAIAAALAGFRYLQRAAGLPAWATAVYAIWPYTFVWSWSLPKIEAAGFAFIFFGLGFLLRRRYLALAGAMAGVFYVHPHSAYFLGFCGGILALARRDVRGLLALAAGTLGVVPLLAAHVSDGCSLSQALYLSRGGMIALTDQLDTVRSQWERVLALAHPLLWIAAALGARELWRRSLPLAVLGLVVLIAYLNELWLPLTGVEARTGLAPLRGLVAMALPVSLAAGVFLASRPRAAPWILAVAGLWTATTAFTATPYVLSVKPFQLAEFQDVRLARCRFAWRGPHVKNEGWGTVRPLRGAIGAAAPD